MNNKLRWSEHEVISYLEHIIHYNTATEKEVEFYLEYIWNGNFNKETFTYKRLIKKMKREWKGE